MKTKVTVNIEQELFVISCGTGYTCLGFDVCFDRSTKLAQELGVTVPMKRYKATKGAYEYYERLIGIARERHNKTGWRSNSELTPQLIGLEEKRVEVKDRYGEIRRFKVGKSTGFIPCHLELANSRSTSGGAVMGAPFEYVKVIS